MIFLCGVLQRTLRAGALHEGENVCREGYHGNTDCFGGDRVVIIPGNSDFFSVEYGPKVEQVYDFMYHDEAIATPAKPLYRPASEALSATRSGEARPQRDLSASVVAP